VDIIASPVDRIDQPDQAAAALIGRVGGLFGEPSGGGQQACQLLAQEGIDVQIGGADRVVRALFPYIQCLATTGFARPAGKCAGPCFLHDGAQAGLVDHGVRPVLMKVCY
jgi:hypothetical protein